MQISFNLETKDCSLRISKEEETILHQQANQSKYSFYEYFYKVVVEDVSRAIREAYDDQIAELNNLVEDLSDNLKLPPEEN